MPNGRVLPSALLYDWLLGRAWGMALISQANANILGPENLDYDPIEADGSYAVERFLSTYAGNEAAALVTQHDQALNGQLQKVATDWANEFQGLVNIVAPIGPGYLYAVQWLQRVLSGGDGLGYLGQDHRNAQAQGFAATIEGSINQRALPMPPGASAALLATAQTATGLFLSRLDAGMTADRRAEEHKLRIDACEAILRARNEALDATLDYLFTEMHLMFDVFGRNNNYLVKMQRDVGVLRNRMLVRGSELSEWESRVRQLDDRTQATIQESEEYNKRQIETMAMEADAQIKLLRRYSSRAASSLNSAGVSVNSSAGENNQVNADPEG